MKKELRRLAIIFLWVGLFNILVALVAFYTHLSTIIVIINGTLGVSFIITTIVLHFKSKQYS